MSDVVVTVEVDGSGRAVGVLVNEERVPGPIADVTLELPSVEDMVYRERIKAPPEPMTVTVTFKADQVVRVRVVK